MTIRSLCGMTAESALSNVVLPLPVPPETAMLQRLRTAHTNKVSIKESNEPRSLISRREKAWDRNLRIVTAGPSRANGGITALTLCPSFKRAFTMGEDSSTRLPRGPTILSISEYTWASSANG